MAANPLTATAYLPQMTREESAAVGPPKLACSDQQWSDLIALADHYFDIKVGTVCPCGEYSAKLFIAVQMWDCKCEEERDEEKLSNAGASITLQRTITNAPDGKTNVQVNALKARVKFGKEEFERCFHVYRR